MSYLVEALKKAERERHARDSGDLHAAAHDPGASARGPGRSWLWLVAVLVAVNVGLVIYIWRPQPPSPAPATSASGDAGAPASATTSTNASSPPADKAAAAAPTVVTDARVPRPVSTPPREAAPTRNTTAPGASPDVASRATGPQAPAASGSAERGDAGSVVYSQVPLTGDAGDDGDAAAQPTGRAPSTTPPTAGNTPAARAAPSADDDENVPAQADVAVPDVEINGQLYSTVPGRSFILVGGRRYHEGERLAAGPAVEQIEPDGAILRYKNQRYHVPGPN